MYALAGRLRRPRASASCWPVGLRRAASQGRLVTEPRASASVVVLSAANEVLLLHRVPTSTSFPLAHVFPGGNLDPVQDGDVPPPGSPDRHRDGPAYRLAAIRECFEETGILLAKRDGALIELARQERDDSRRRIHTNRMRFTDWLNSLGGAPDTDGLVPFTRWITPVASPKRYTTQMYLYLLPPSSSHDASPSEAVIPSPDNGVEHLTALFAPAQTFLSRAADRSIILLPPQVYLLTLLAGVLAGDTTAESSSSDRHRLHDLERRKLLAFCAATPPPVSSDDHHRHWTSAISWADKVMCPYRLPIASPDGRTVLALDQPGPELAGSGRGGDWDRLMLANLTASGPLDVELRLRTQLVDGPEGGSDRDGSRL